VSALTVVYFDAFNCKAKFCFRLTRARSLFSADILLIFLMLSYTLTVSMNLSRGALLWVWLEVGAFLKSSEMSWVWILSNWFRGEIAHYNLDHLLQGVLLPDPLKLGNTFFLL